MTEERKPSTSGLKQVVVKFPRSIQYTTSLLTESDYRALSPEWARLRRAVLKRDGHRCTQCGAAFNLQVHHIRYPEVWGEEREEELITVCDKCHRQIHGKED